MNANQDIRWHQRLKNFRAAFNELHDAVILSRERELSKLEEQGLIQGFEYTYELAWNCIKDFYRSQGEVGIQGSRDAIRLAFERGLIDDGAIWMNMLTSRTLTPHTYNRETARQIAQEILHQYYSQLRSLLLRLEERRQHEA